MQHAIDCWTPDLVKETLVEAVKWARRAAGPVGPADLRGGSMPYVPMDEDFDVEEWGLRETADPEDDKPKPRPVYDPARAQRLSDALQWQARYVAAPGNRRLGPCACGVGAMSRLPVRLSARGPEAPPGIQGVGVPPPRPGAGANRTGA